MFDLRPEWPRGRPAMGKWAREEQVQGPCGKEEAGRGGARPRWPPAVSTEAENAGGGGSKARQGRIVKTLVGIRKKFNFYFKCI